MTLPSHWFFTQRCREAEFAENFQLSVSAIFDANCMRFIWDATGCFVFASPPHPRQRKRFRVAGQAAKGGRSSRQGWQVWPQEVAGLAVRGGRSSRQRWQVKIPGATRQRGKRVQKKAPRRDAEGCVSLAASANTAHAANRTALFLIILPDLFSLPWLWASELQKSTHPLHPASDSKAIQSAKAL